MGCCGAREKAPPEYTQKWEYMNLSDFKATSAWNTVAYIWLWLLGVIAVAVYAVDTFTAVNLLVFDKWSSQIQPAVEFKITKWIFAACILFSWALCFYEWTRALRIIKRGGVAESYMDPLAASLQSMRPNGWRRFLVFTELTKSRKGADYVALFVYFSFKTAIRVILAEGPRQAINAMSLYAVMNAELIAHGPTEHSSFEQFWINLGIMFDTNKLQALIFFSMLFTLIIWVFSMLSLAIAAILYILFLWHYIPQRDGRLSIYCRRKIDKRLEKILESKITMAVGEQQRQQQRDEMKAELKRQKTGEMPPPQAPTISRAPTLPVLGNSPNLSHNEKFAEMTLDRKESNVSSSTLPPYTSRPPTRNEVPGVFPQPPLSKGGAGMPQRAGTQSSSTTWCVTNFEPDAPLLANAGYGGDGGHNAPLPIMPMPAYDGQGRPFPGRTMTPTAQRGPRPFSPIARASPAPFSPVSARGPMNSASGTAGPPPKFEAVVNFGTQPRFATPAVQDPYSKPLPVPSQQSTQMAFNAGPLRQPTFGGANVPPSFNRPTEAHRKPPATSFNRPFTPGVARVEIPPQQNTYEMTSQPSRSTVSSQESSFGGAGSGGGYVAFNPSAYSATSPPKYLQPGPERNVTVAGVPGAGDSYFGLVADTSQRSATSPLSERNTMMDILSAYGPSARNSTVSDAARTPSPLEGPNSHTSTPAGPLSDPNTHRQRAGW